ncbi:hypothetical protein BS78_01G281100 [Paspalum vaginatum]|nr:hypothetical protein BS78_01G281100 [Paspalum vaginatum]
MASTTAVPPPPAVPERRVPVVPRLADDGGGGRVDARGSSSAGGGGGGSGSVAGISPSILIIAVIVVVMLLASLCIHYFIRHLCRHVGAAGPSSASSRQAPPLPLVARPAAGASVAPADGQAAAAGGGGKAAAAAEAEAERLIARLPLFTLSSSLASVPKSSRDCAVCQSAFRDDDELRLLPACRHAFHSRCVDPWLRGNPSCPLCRASIALPHPPLTDLLRVELGSVSSRRSNPDAAAAAVRAYPLPGGLPNSASSEYLVEEEVQVVLKPSPRAAAVPGGSSDPPSQQQQQLAAVERGQPSSSSSVGLTPTASFRSTAERWSSRWSNRWSSRWSSGRWSSRYDAGTVTAAATAEWWWDMDGGVAPAARRREAEDGTASFYGFVRWLTGAY